MFETRIRTIIRIRRQKGTSRHNPVMFLFFQSNAIFVAPFTEFCSPSKTAQAEPNVRSRNRGTIMRMQRTETRTRTKTRIRRQKGTIPASSKAGIISRRIVIITIALITCTSYLFGKGIALSGMSHRKYISVSSWELRNSFISGRHGSCTV